MNIVSAVYLSMYFVFFMGYEFQQTFDVRRKAFPWRHFFLMCVHTLALFAMVTLFNN